MPAKISNAIIRGRCTTFGCMGHIKYSVGSYGAPARTQFGICHQCAVSIAESLPLDVISAALPKMLTKDDDVILKALAAEKTIMDKLLKYAGISLPNPPEVPKTPEIPAVNNVPREKSQALAKPTAKTVAKPAAKQTSVTKKPGGK